MSISDHNFNEIAAGKGAKILLPTLTALLSILEAPLAPIWAWLILSEIPALSTMIGGAIVILATILATIRMPPVIEKRPFD